VLLVVFLGLGGGGAAACGSSAAPGSSKLRVARFWGESCTSSQQCMVCEFFGWGREAGLAAAASSVGCVLNWNQHIRGPVCTRTKRGIGIVLLLKATGCARIVFSPRQPFLFLLFLCSCRLCGSYSFLIMHTHFYCVAVLESRRSVCSESQVCVACILQRPISLHGRHVCLSACILLLSCIPVYVSVCCVLRRSV
jgi:hypothetical protein